MERVLRGTGFLPLILRHRFTLPIAISILTFVVAVRSIHSLPIAYYDEMLWIFRSFQFEYFITGKFKDPVWQTYFSYDQPKAAEFAYGAWLYPLYLSEKRTDAVTSRDYTTFLLSKGFIEHPEFLPANHRNTVRSIDMTRFLPIGYGGTLDDMVARFGESRRATAEVVYHARRLNAVLLAATAFIVVLMVHIVSGPFAACVAGVLWAFNPLLLEVGLRAHSDGLFLFLYVLSVYAMYRYFSGRRSFIGVIGIGISVGLCFATKLNGAVLIPLFPILWYVLRERRQTTGHGFRSLLVYGYVLGAVAFGVFVAINPYTYDNPVPRTLFLASHRMDTVISQYLSGADPLPTVLDRLVAPVRHFTSPKGIPYFTLPGSFGIPVSVLSGIVGALSAVGLVAVYRNRSAAARGMLVSFLWTYAAALWYLKLDWDRYFVQFLPYVLLFMATGVAVVAHAAMRLLHMLPPKKPGI